MSSLPRLPLDCLIHILSQLPPSRSKEGEESFRTLARCSQVDSTFRQASVGTLLWEPHYRARYLHSVDANEEARKKAHGESYRDIFAERRKLDRRALTLVNNVVRDRRGRSTWANELAKLRFDIWDVLQIECDNLDGNMSIHVDGSEPTFDATKLYWIQALQESITRGHGIRLCRQISQDELPFVEAYSSISCFFGKTHHEVNNALHAITAQGHSYLSKAGVSLLEEDQNYSRKSICVKICEFMREQGFGPVEGSHFHDISNSFPHSYLTTHRKSIPISLVHVFVAIARFVGVDANPVNFPGRVLAHVSEPAAHMDDFYVDVYASPSEAVLSSRDDIPRLLRAAGVAGSRIMEFARPCGPIPMLTRSARNIMTALQTVNPSSSAALTRAAITFTFLIHIQLSNRSDLVAQFITTTEPIECATYIAVDMVDSYPEGSETRELLMAGVEEVLNKDIAEAEIIHYRSEEETSLQHFVGMLFIHRRYDYVGCVYGWDPVCAASDEWCRKMGVDGLPRKRNQPFYQSYCEDGGVRYVAEDNIRPLVDYPRSTLEQNINTFCENITELPRYFAGVHLGDEGNGKSRARFVLSPELLDAYPEDDAIGRAWIAQAEANRQ